MIVNTLDTLDLACTTMDQQHISPQERGLDRFCSSSQTVSEDTQGDTTTQLTQIGPPELILFDPARYTSTYEFVEKNVGLIDWLLNVDRLTVDQVKIRCQLPATVSTIRKAMGRSHITKRNNHPVFVQRVVSAYVVDNLTLAQVQQHFVIGPAAAKQILLQLRQTDRAIAITAIPDRATVKRWLKAGKTYADIAQMTSLPPATIQHRLRQLEISRYSIAGVFEDELRQLYCIDKLMCSEIAKILGNVTYTAVNLALQECQITRPVEDSRYSKEQYNLKRFGVLYPTQLPHRREISRSTPTEALIARVPTLLNAALLAEMLVDNTLLDVSKQLGVSDHTVAKYCDMHGIQYQTKTERETELKNGSYQKYLELALLPDIRGYAHEIVPPLDWAGVNTKINIRCQTHGLFHPTFNNYRLFNVGCIKCQGGTSKPEKELFEYVKSLYPTAVPNDRVVLNRKELDVLCYDKKVAFELNGVYWHSSNVPHDKHNATRHLQKTDGCNTAGLKLFHIWDAEWIDTTNNLKWKSVIANSLGHSDKIFGRHTTITTVGKRVADKFFDKNHLQGKCVGNTVNVALLHNGEMVSVMSFGRSRYDKSMQWELLRSCTILHHTVVGGMSKMFKYFVQEYHPTSVVSYANRRWSNGNVYTKMGFSYCGTTAPNYWYTKDCITMESRLKYQKHKLRVLFPDCPITMTEEEIMFANKYLKIYDSGQLKFVWTPHL